MLAAALHHAGHRAQTIEVPTSTPNPIAAHLEINRSFGMPGHAAHAAIAALMKRVAGQ